MKNTLIIFVFGVFAANLFAQPTTPVEYGLKHYNINSFSLGEINFYVTINQIEETKPVLILLDGSGHTPIYLLHKTDNGYSNITSTIPFDYNELSHNYHVVLISKPGTPFFDSIQVNSSDGFI
ncbi:hypothetical protein [Carboxylicivirga sp. N1Y90]|uniref:hypothetical protein n=1 Tax=Carboxylicivirga fragile TaxID=3417571 RepID=UPI003D330115|nr:hypothetical protein [Marinilabiliaceae bacterium N1Y90]